LSLFPPFEVHFEGRKVKIETNPALSNINTTAMLLKKKKKKENNKKKNKKIK
jgi:hypothetical protein